MLYYEHARFQGKLDEILEKHSLLGHRLKFVVMGDMGTRYDMIFEDSDKYYSYAHIACRRATTLVKMINDYESNGYKLVFYFMSDLATRYELFFEIN